LYAAIKKFTKIRIDMDKRYASFIVSFIHHKSMTPQEFEVLLWKQLNMLHQIDEYGWDQRVSNDVLSPHFSFSIAGDSYFIIGMCPNHPRKCREFIYPTLIFNSHHQFRYLKKINLFKKIQTIVRSREMQYSGSINPNLIDFENRSEAMQYSGLKASSTWQCPFKFGTK
jgi:FPC/CPF motif-containing protein YcgG